MMWDKKIYNRSGYGATPIVFVLIPLVLLGGFLLFSYTRDTHTPEIKAIAIKERSSQDNLSIDSDQDGLKDWEEQIYGTDAHNPDTDGDGTKDGDEITQGRDPLKRGPDDYLTKKDIASPSAPSTNNGEQQNVTQKIAEIIGEDYLMQHVQNPEEKPDIDAIADKMAQVLLNQATSSAPSITTHDITVIHNANKDDMDRYIKQFGVILKSSFLPIASEKKIMDSITDTFSAYKDTRSLPQTDTLARWLNGYDKFLTDIKTLPVPEDFASLHIEYVNTVIKEREALTRIHGIKDDTALAIAGLKELTHTKAQFYILGKKYHQLEEDKGLILAHK